MRALRRRVSGTVSSSHSDQLIGTGAITTATTSLRCASTGEHHSYRPGCIAKLLRSVYVAITPRGLHRRVAIGLQARMERVQELEKEQLWLQQHGSPLRVMGLPEHAELTEVRARYRDLVIETHPDTAQGDAKAQYDLVQTAYKMATSPTSLWHQNGSAPMIYRHLVGSSATATRRVTVFALFSYCVMGIIGIIFSAVVVRQSLEVALRLFDPEFYAFMIAQEEDEQRRRLAGEVVDTDPKRLAPTAVKRLLFPGRFVHSNSSNSSSNDTGTE
ncbi:chaperone protein DNAJ [Trypanosoma theileri]|uniref:Chaperone protein DNAJ n=1 Tax=Trypanosoma theileri TaxID=67003 RepID=A0A1X0NT05_9TRYP|nr:chaperone protein DNAJ [Trypanosoma theileri]ORC87845.1 chaperone protein DNAJ [Trypanosoma theileri]